MSTNSSPDPKPATAKIDVVIFGFILLVSGAAQVFTLTASYFVDDSWITFNYARSLATGNGFEYSPEFQTLGTTTPLFTVALALASLTGIKIPVAALLLNYLGLALQFIFVLMVSWQILPRLRFCSLAILVWSLTYLYPTNIPGMEYGLYTALCFLSLWAASTERWLLAAVLASVTGVTRIDGLLCAAVVGCAFLIKNRKNLWQWRFYFLICLLPVLWYGFSLLYFGALTPSHIETKQFEAKALGRFGFQWLEWLWNPEYNIYYFPVVMAALVICLWKRRDLLIYYIFIVLYGLLYYIYYIPGVFFYFLPIFMLGHLSVIILAGWYVENAANRRVRLPVLGFILFMLMPPLLLSAFYFHEKATHNPKDRYYYAFEPIAHQLAKYPQNTVTVATPEIGVIGFYSNQRILELGGLVNDQARPYFVSGRIEEYIIPIRPDLFVAPAANTNDVQNFRHAWFGYANDTYVLLAQIYTSVGDKVVVYATPEFVAEHGLKSHSIYANHVREEFLIPAKQSDHIN